MGFDFSSLDTVDLGMNTKGNDSKKVNKTKVEKENIEPIVLKSKTTKVKKEISNIDNSNEINNLSDLELLNKIETMVNKIQNIKTELNVKFIERENEIEMLILALISSSNAFLHGPAGTGKSLLTEELSNRIINSNYFRILMGKTTEPAEIFGAVSINAMKNDTYKVNTVGKLPQAHIGFTDEVFKANSAVLNGLLTIMNEKLFFNDVVEEVPLISLIGASNEYPEEDNLGALYDRFLLRWHVNYIQEPGKRMDLFTNYLNSRKQKSKISNQEVAATNTETSIELNDLLLVNEACKEVDIPMKLLGAYNMIFVKLEKMGIIISDRRKNESLKVVQASAILNNRKVAQSEDLEPLKYCLWNEPKELQVVMDCINELANPNKVKYDGFLSTFINYRKDMDEIESRKDSSDYDYDKSVKITEINKNLNYVVTEIDKILNKLDKKSKDFNLFTCLRSDITNYLSELLKNFNF